MPLVVCCPCGNPFDSQNLELVVSVVCPRCGRDFVLELDSGPAARSRAILTVVEGPRWVGERFVIPVGVDLTIGTAPGNWISLDGADIAEAHCKLHLSPDGQASISDQDTASGTWVESRRVRQCRLAPQQSFIVGGFHFRVGFLSADGADSGPVIAPILDVAQPLPALADATQGPTPGEWLNRNRFQVARGVVRTFACLTGILHVCILHQASGHDLKLATAVLAGMVILAVLMFLGNRITLVERSFTLAGIVALALLAGVDVYWGMQWPAIAAALLAGCLALLLFRLPSNPTLVVSACFAVAAVTSMTVRTLMAVVAAFAAPD